MILWQFSLAVKFFLLPQTHLGFKLLKMLGVEIIILPRLKLCQIRGVTRFCEEVYE
jgi:hypothetical protein